MKVEPL